MGKLFKNRKAALRRRKKKRLGLASAGPTGLKHSGVHLGGGEEERSVASRFFGTGRTRKDGRTGIGKGVERKGRNRLRDEATKKQNRWASVNETG